MAFPNLTHYAPSWANRENLCSASWKALKGLGYIGGITMGAFFTSVASTYLPPCDAIPNNDGGNIGPNYSQQQMNTTPPITSSNPATDDSDCKKLIYGAFIGGLVIISGAVIITHAVKRHGFFSRTTASDIPSANLDTLNERSHLIHSL